MLLSFEICHFPQAVAHRRKSLIELMRFIDTAETLKNDGMLLGFVGLFGRNAWEFLECGIPCGRGRRLIAELASCVAQQPVRPRRCKGVICGITALGGARDPKRLLG